MNDIGETCKANCEERNKEERVRERERECVCVYVCVCVYSVVLKNDIEKNLSKMKPAGWICVYVCQCVSVCVCVCVCVCSVLCVCFVCARVRASELKPPNKRKTDPHDSLGADSKARDNVGHDVQPRIFVG